MLRLLGGEEVGWKIWCINMSEELPKLVWGLLVCLPVFSSESWMSRFRWWLGGPIQIHHQITLSRRKPLKRPINKKLWVKEAVSLVLYNDIGDTFGSKKTFQSCGSWNRKQLAKLPTLCSLKLRSRPGMRWSGMILLYHKWYILFFSVKSVSFFSQLGSFKVVLLKLSTFVCA